MHGISTMFFTPSELENIEQTWLASLSVKRRKEYEAHLAHGGATYAATCNDPEKIYGKLPRMNPVPKPNLEAEPSDKMQAMRLRLDYAERLLDELIQYTETNAVAITSIENARRAQSAHSPTTEMNHER